MSFCTLSRGASATPQSRSASSVTASIAASARARNSASPSPSVLSSAGPKTTTQRENGSGRRKRSHEFRNLGRDEDEDDGRTSPFALLGEDEDAALALPRGAARTVGRERAAGRRLQRLEELGAKPRRRRATRSRAPPTKPQYFRNVAMISPSSLCDAIVT